MWLPFLTRSQCVTTPTVITMITIVPSQQNKLITEETKVEKNTWFSKTGKAFKYTSLKLIITSVVVIAT